MTSSIVYVLLCASTSNPAGFDSTIEGKKNRIYRVDADAHSRRRRHRRHLSSSFVIFHHLSSSFVNVVSTHSSATFGVGYAHRKNRYHRPLPLRAW